MNILFITHDFTQQAATSSSIKGVTSFTDGIQLMEFEQFDGIVADSQVAGENFTQYWDYFLGTPYIILADEAETTWFQLIQPPVAVYPPTHHLNQLEEMFGLFVKEETPNMAYAERICGEDKDLLGEMVLILQRQFLEALEKIPYLYENENREALFQAVHKLTGKFSILSLGASFSFFNRVELYLRGGYDLKKCTYNHLLSDLRVALDYINRYIHTNELYNS